MFTRLRRLSLLVLPLVAILGAGVVVAQTKPITQVWPTAGSKDNGLGTAVGLSFARAMDSTSTEAAFNLDPAVAGRFQWSDDGLTLQFLPAEPLPPEVVFKATLDVGARDRRGQAVLTQPYSWTFRTGQVTDQLRFGYNVPVQLVTPAGKKGVPVQPGLPRLTLDLALYRVDLPAFAERYAKIKPYEDDVIPTEGLEVVTRWQQYVDATEAMAAIDLPPGTPSGLYLLDARHPLAGEAQTFVVYSDYALVAKAGLTERTVWVSRLFTGEPAPGVRVALYDAAGTELPGQSQTADADGVARFAGGQDARFAVAEVDGGIALVGLDTYWASDGYWWGWWDRGGYSPQRPEFAGHVHTDRPIYRPGHTVHYKATLRRFTTDAYTLIEATVPVTVTIHDAQGNTLSTTNPTLDEFGSLSGDLVLGDDVSLGTWNVQVGAGRQSIYGYFEVQAYVKPDFEVTVATEKPYYVRGDTARFDVEARYYFGQPAAGAAVTLRLYRGYYYRGSDTPTLKYDGVLDDEGQWSASVRLPDDGTTNYAEWWYMEAEVVDQSRRPVVNSGSVVVHPAEFELSLLNDRYGVESGQPVRLTARTMDHDGGPVAGRQVNVEVQQYQYYEGRGATQVTIQKLTVTTGADGMAPVTLPGLKDGWYSVQATATDNRGHVIPANSYAWIYDTLRPWYWWGGLEVAADKDSYVPGDTATLLVKSPVTGTALVTLERDDVYYELVVPVKGATAVEIPIKAEYAPNVYARVHIWQPQTYESNRSEGQLLSGEVQLVVPATDKRLAVTVVPDKATYEPGEQATFSLQVRDAAGRPVKAQVSLAVVDKAVLALASDRNGAVFDAFWGPRYQRADTYNSLQPSNWYGYKENMGGDGGGRGPQPPGAGTATPAPAAPSPQPSDQASQATPRREFPDTAFWDPAIVTDANGEAQISFKLPDTLTTWQALARAVTVDTAAGEGEAEVVVTKAIMADPALPRFAVQGDQFVLDVLARNYAGGTLDAACSLDTPGLVQLDPGDKRLSLPFNETTFARWSVVASTVGTNPVTARLTTSAGDDAIELPLEVKPFTAPDRFVRAGGVETEVTESFEVPFNAEPNTSSVEVRLAPAMAVSVLDGLESLIDFPYGCVEQTMSRVLPNAVVGRLVLELDIQAPEITRRLPEVMSLGLQKLYGFQNDNGSWGWWYSGGNVYTTSYVLFGLTLTQQAGFEVDPTVLEQGFSWLAANLDAEPDARMRAFALYVMAEAGRGDEARTVGLFDGSWVPPVATATPEPKPREAANPDALPAALPGDLDTFSLAALAVALHRVGHDDLAGQAADMLVARANETPTTASWPMPKPPDGRWWWWDSFYWRSMASTEKSTAMALEALAVLRPTSPLAPKAARWLLENRYGQGWSSTQATAFAVLALTDYINASGELRSNYDWSVTLDGAIIAEGQVSSSNVTKRIPAITLTGDQLTPGQHALVLEKRGSGTLFYTVVGRMALYYDGFAATSASGIGMSMVRAYSPIEETQAATTDFNAGDVVNVRLTLTTADDLWYVMIEDPLPAGLEGLNEELNTETKRVPGQEPWWWWRWWGYERKEVRDDRVTFFATRLPAGSHTFDYAARAVTPGTFAARPAEASTMYRPEIWARSASVQVTIDPERVATRPVLSGDFDRDCRLTDFDTRLVATDWAAGRGRDLSGDRRVTVLDVAVANGRAGAMCGQGVGPPPGTVGAMHLALQAPANPPQGQTFVVDVVANGGGNVGGFEATVSLPAGAFEVVNVAAGPALAGARLLGPVVAGNTVRFGGFVTTGSSADGDRVLARLTLKAVVRADGGELQVTEAQVVTDHGGEYTVTADGTVVSPQPWRPVGSVYLPWLSKN